MESAKYTILVVEDDIQWQGIIEETLTDEGYYVRIAGTYDEARESLDSEQIDLLVLDLSLAGPSPILDGPRLLRRLRKSGVDVPCIIVSGVGTVPLVRQAFIEFAVKDFFEKNSFDFRVFTQIIKTALAQSPQRHPINSTLDFHIHFGTPVGDIYPVTIQSPAGTGKLDLPQNLLSDQDFLYKLPTEQEAKQIGGYLFEALFQNVPISAELLRRSQDRLTEHQVLNILLSMDLAAAAQIDPVVIWPWEYIYDIARREFVNLSSQCRLIRHVPFVRANEQAKRVHARQMLIVAAQPGNLPTLDIEREIQVIQQATHDRAIQVRVLTQATRKTLHEALHIQPVQILHFIGHSAWDLAHMQSVFYMETDQGYTDPVDGERLANLILGERGTEIQLVFLNACQTVVGQDRGSRTIWHGMASQLAMRGVPSVIAMKSPISDAAAYEFAHQFYQDWLAGHMVSEAVASGRRRVHTQAQSDLAEWGVPILFQS